MIMIYVVVAAAIVGSFVVLVACRLCRTENKTQKADATRSLFSFGGAWRMAWRALRTYFTTGNV